MVNVWQNGYPIHEQIAIPHPTGHGKPESPNLCRSSPTARQSGPIPQHLAGGQHQGHPDYIPQLPLKVYQFPGDSYGRVWLHIPHAH